MRLLRATRFRSLLRSVRCRAADVSVRLGARPAVLVPTPVQATAITALRTRDLLVRQRTQTINSLRGHLAEYGVTAPQGPAHVGRLARAVEDPDSALPEPVRELGGLLLAQIAELEVKVAGLESDLNACARQDEEATRLMTIPGIGPVTAMALQAFAPPMEGFQRGRDFSAWCRASTPPGASRGWARHRRWANATSGGC